MIVAVARGTISSNPFLASEGRMDGQRLLGLAAWPGRIEFGF